MTLKQVVFPAPLGPIRPRISPFLISKATSLSATTPPNLNVTLSTTNSASPLLAEVLVLVSRVCSDIGSRLLCLVLAVFELSSTPSAGHETLRSEHHER